MKYNRMTRRMFLQGSGQFALAIPLLPSLLPKAEAQTVDASVKYVQFIHNHGAFPSYFWPSSGNNPNQTFSQNGATVPDLLYRPLSGINGQLSYILTSAFDSVRGKMNLIRGLHGICNDNWHNNCYPTTGANPTTDHGTAGYPYSLDTILEKSAKFYPTPVRIPALRMTPGVNSAYKWGSYSWGVQSGNPTRISCFDSNTTAFNQIFTNVTNTQGDPKAALRSTVADQVLEDYKRIAQSNKLSSADKSQLANYMDLINDLQKRLKAAVPSACAKPTLTAENNYDVLHKNGIDIAVAAMLCGITKVVAYHCYHGANDSHDEEVYHNWCHDGSEQNHANMTRWRATQLARLLNRMNSVTETNGKTLLDNSMVIYSNELSHPGHGTEHFYDMPVIVAGSANGKLTTGNYINYVRRPYNNLMVTVMQTMGLQPADYEQNGVVGYGGYSGYLVKNVNQAYLSNAEKRKPLPMLYKG